MDEPPSSEGLIPQIRNWLFPNMQHEKLVSVAFHFLRYHWKKYGEMKVYAHGTPQIDEYYQRIVALRSSYNAKDDVTIRQSIKEVNQALLVLKESNRSKR